MPRNGAIPEPVAIEPVASAAQRERFIRLPERIMAGDPNWRAPLLLLQRDLLSPKENPYFEHGEAQLWIARRGGRDVGRISAQVDSLAPPDPDGPVGHFGMIVAEDDAEVFAALFAAAEAWLRGRGCVRAVGPFNLSVNDEAGLLVDGFDTPPPVMMGHDPPYADARIQALGWTKAKDLYAYWTGPPTFPEAIQRRLGRPMKGFVLRPMRTSRFNEEVDTLVEIFNDAWAGNWGFIPMTPKESRHLATSLRLLIHPRFIWFTEIDGEPAGMIVLVPNLNEAAEGLNGRLFPFGWAKLLWRLKVKRVKTGRVPLMGVKRKFARDPRGILSPFLLVDQIVKNGMAQGMEAVDMSWILEDNLPMRHILQGFGADCYKTYRLYEKRLA